MTTRIRFFGVAGYEIVTPNGKHILVDPFIDSSPLCPVKSEELERVDLILVSHAAYDHFGDAEAIARRTGAPIVCPSDVFAFLRQKGLPESQLRATIWGLPTQVAEVMILPVECHHWSHLTLPNGQYASGVPMGFIIHASPTCRFYHYGDTAIFSDLKLIGELHRPTIGALGITTPVELEEHDPCAGRIIGGEMSPREGALAAQWLGLETVLPCHYLNPDCADVHEFNRLLGAAAARGERVPKSVVLKPGDWITA